MNIATHKEDLVLAQETCLELRSGNNDAILPVYRKYQSMFMGYTRRRVHSSDDDRATSILTDFWKELLNAKAICDFKGLSSLKTYLFKILNFRIIDNVRKDKRQEPIGGIISYPDDDSDGIEDDNGVSPEEDLMHKETIRLIHETLLMLAESSPTDAYLIKMQMEGLSYQEMAKQLLGNKPKSDRELKKKTDSIKKQFTRKTSGSMAKFKSCLERMMIKNQLAYSDLVN